MRIATVHKSKSEMTCALVGFEGEKILQGYFIMTYFKITCQVGSTVGI